MSTFHRSVHKSKFGVMSDGAEVDEYILTNARGAQVRVITYGGIITSIWVPDRSGHLANVALGLDTLADYEHNNAPYLGCIAGRFANRIAEGKFTLDGTAYTLAINNGPNHLHGGLKGLDKRVWQGEAAEEHDRVGVVLRYVSPDGEEGYPGTVTIQVRYSWTDDTALVIDYHATTDKPTILNLTNHTYFNLAGESSGRIDGHLMQLNADYYTPVHETMIPTGELASVAGTPFDFRAPRLIGPGLRANHPQIARGFGYDHNFVINRAGAGAGALAQAARVYAPTTGRVMEVWTTEPGVQFYAGNFLDRKLVGRAGRVYRQNDGLCLETQHYPDSPNQADFPSVVLRPGATLTSQTVYRFSTD
jgi:aldose 1-epimerase